MQTNLDQHDVGHFSMNQLSIRWPNGFEKLAGIFLLPQLVSFKLFYIFHPNNSNSKNYAAVTSVLIELVC